jgi:hypothetical protein
MWKKKVLKLGIITQGWVYDENDRFLRLYEKAGVIRSLGGSNRECPTSLSSMALVYGV